MSIKNNQGSASLELIPIAFLFFLLLLGVHHAHQSLEMRFRHIVEERNNALRELQ